MTNEGMYSRILHIQKGDCADASKLKLKLISFCSISTLLIFLLQVEHEGKNWPWSKKPDNCRECESNNLCNKEICVATQSVQ